jgi:hypothetical protein
MDQLIRISILCRKSLIAICGTALCATNIVHASTYTGPVTFFEVQPSPIANGNIRVSIQVPAGTTNANCTGYGGAWYSYDLPAGALASMWGAQLLAAIVSQRNIQILGTGQCDPLGIETVGTIGST